MASNLTGGILHRRQPRGNHSGWIDPRAHRSCTEAIVETDVSGMVADVEAQRSAIIASRQSLTDAQATFRAALDACFPPHDARSRVPASFNAGTRTVAQS